MKNSLSPQDQMVREKNSPIIVSQDGKIVALDPFDVPESISSEKEVGK